MAEELLFSVQDSDEEIEAASAEEIGCRVADVESGTARLIPAEEVFAEIWPAEVISVRFHDAARSELAQEVLCYAEIDRRLGERLFKSVQRAVALAAEFGELARGTCLAAAENSGFDTEGPSAGLAGLAGQLSAG